VNDVLINYNFPDLLSFNFFLMEENIFTNSVAFPANSIVVKLFAISASIITSNQKRVHPLLPEQYIFSNKIQLLNGFCKLPCNSMLPNLRILEVA
jgi:hypothetical protein